MYANASTATQTQVNTTLSVPDRDAIFIATSSYIFFRWLAAQRPSTGGGTATTETTDRHQADEKVHGDDTGQGGITSGTTGATVREEEDKTGSTRTDAHVGDSNRSGCMLKFAGRGGKVLSALEEDFPELDFRGIVPSWSTNQISTAVGQVLNGKAGAGEDDKEQHRRHGNQSGKRKTDMTKSSVTLHSSSIDTVQGDNSNRMRRHDSRRMETEEKAVPMSLHAPAETSMPWTWEDRYEQLEEFRRGHGHASVPCKFQSNLGLGRWVTTQRRYYKLRKEGKVVPLTDERITKLEILGFVWNAQKTKPKTWAERFEELVRFKDEHGHTRVPREYGQGLGEWCRLQKRFHRRDDPTIRGERTDKLNDIGFEWNLRTEPKTWEERFEQLVAYRARHGRIPIDEEDGSNGKSKHVEHEGNDDDGGIGDAAEHRSLLKWMQKNNAGYRAWEAGRKTILTKNRINKLRSLGFDFHIVHPLGDHRNNNKVPWNTRIEDLRSFKLEHGHVDVPLSYTGRNGLGIWLSNVRQYRHCLRQIEEGGIVPKKMTMTPEQFEELAKLGVHFQAFPHKNIPWEKRLEQLLEFKANTGHTRVPQGWTENKSLSGWVMDQRKQRKKMLEGKSVPMTEERLRKLEEIGFEFVVGKDLRKSYKGRELRRDSDGESSSEEEPVASASDDGDGR